MTKRPKRRKYKIMRTRRAFVTADIRKSAREAVSDERADLLEQLSTVEPDSGIPSGPDASPSAEGEAKPSEALAPSTVASHHMTAQSETDAFGGEGTASSTPWPRPATQPPSRTSDADRAPDDPSEEVPF